MPNYDAMTEKDLKSLSDTLIEWSKQPTSLHLAGFTTTLIPPKTRTWLYGMADRHPKIAEALQIARENLAEKYVSGSALGKLTPFAEKYLPIYDKEYKKIVEWKAKLSKQDVESIKATFSEIKNAVADGTLLKLLEQSEDKK